MKLSKVSLTGMSALMLVLALVFSGCNNPTGGDDPPTTYTISGTITTSDGGDAAGAGIQLKDNSGSNVGPAVTAGPNGVYSISGVPAGTGYTIKVSLAGYVSGTITAFNVSANVSDKNMRLDAVTTTYTVSGEITTSDGESAAGANVQLKDGITNVVPAVTVGSNGAYTISNVPPGTGYTIEVSLTGYSTGTSEAFDVGSDNVSGINCQLAVYTDPTYTISGAISTSDNGSAEGASVQLKNSGGSNVGSVVSAGSDGAYSILSVPAGTGYTIVVSLTGYRTGTIAAFNVSAAVPGKNLTLDRLYTVSGAITTDDGGSAAGAKVQLKNGATNVGSAVTVGSSGEYTIPNVLAGTYTIEVSLTGYRTGTIADFPVGSADVTGKNLELVKQKTLKITGIDSSITGPVTALLFDYGVANNWPAGGTATVVNGTAIISLQTFSNNAFTTTDWIGEPGNSEWSFVLWEGEEDAIRSRDYGYALPGSLDFSGKETVVQFSQLYWLYTLQWGVWFGTTYSEASSEFSKNGLPLTPAGPNAGYLTGDKAIAAFDAIAGAIQEDPFDESGERTATFQYLVADYFDEEYGTGFPDALKTALMNQNASNPKAPLAGVFEVEDDGESLIVVFYITKD